HELLARPEVHARDGVAGRANDEHTDEERNEPLPFAVALYRRRHMSRSRVLPLAGIDRRMTGRNAGARFLYVGPGLLRVERSCAGMGRVMADALVVLEATKR